MIWLILALNKDGKGNEIAQDVKGSGKTFGAAGDCPAGWNCKGSGKNKNKCQKNS